MKGGFRVRRATARDVETLIRQRHAMLAELRPRTDEEMRIHDEAFRRWAVRKMKEKELFCFLAEEPGGRAVAGGAVWLREHQPRPGRAEYRFPYLLSVYTEPEFRGRGLATLLLKHTADWARKNGHEKIVLHASKMGEPVYERFGYKRTNEMEYVLTGKVRPASAALSKRSAR